MSKNNRTADRVQAVWNILGGEEGVDLLLSGEITVTEPSRSWREQNGVIYFSVTSNGMTGEQWIERLEGKGYHVHNRAESLLRSPDFKPTSGVTTVVAVLKGMFFKTKIRAEADERKLTKPNAEIACLIREKFTNKELEAMGLGWIVVMHEPIRDFAGDPRLLNANRYDSDCPLNACYAHVVDSGWGRKYGLAFAVSQVSA